MRLPRRYLGTLVLRRASWVMSRPAHHAGDGARMVSLMTERTLFTHAISNPAARRDIALAVQSGIPVEQLAEEFNISVATVHRYVNEW